MKQSLGSLFMYFHLELTRSYESAVLCSSHGFPIIPRILQGVLEVGATPSLACWVWLLQMLLAMVYWL